MVNILTEAPVATAVAAWKREHNGEAPNTESPEFKAYKKQIDKQYNVKQQDKADNDKNINKFCDTLYDIYQQAPQKFPQEFYNALTNLSKKGKVNLCNMVLQKINLQGESKTWIQVIGNLYNSNKTESADITLEAMKESAKYPWISGLLNHRLIKEDDFNLDNFDASVASTGGMNIKSDTTSNDTSTDTNSQGNEEFNLDDMDIPDADNGDNLHITPAGGSVDSISGGMGDDMVDPIDGVPADTPDYRVIDVMFDEKDPETAPKVKVQNVETGEIEIKDLCEIDV